MGTGVYGFQSEASLCFTFCVTGNNAQKSVILPDLYDFFVCIFYQNKNEP
jgi:hypothetical protein